MQYKVNKEKKSAFEREVFIGDILDRLHRYAAWAMAAIAVLNAISNIVQIRIHGSYSTGQFVCCIVLLGASFFAYGFTLASAYKRRRTYADRIEEQLEITDSYLCYSYCSANSSLRVEYKIPFSELHAIDKSFLKNLCHLRGHFEKKYSFGRPNDDPTVLHESDLFLADYFEGIDIYEYLSDYCTDL